MKNNWQTKKLGEICDFQNGFAFKSSDYSDDGFFVMRIGNVQDGYISLSDPKYIKKSYKLFDKFILQSGDILISLTGNVGRVGVIEEEHLPAVINQRVARIVLKSEDIIHKQFLLYFLSSSYFIKKLIGAGHGAAQQNISTKDIENLEIPLPSFSEQKRIVKILDDAFEKVVKAKGNVGKNLENSKELFKSYLQNIFADKENKWDKKKLDDVCIVERGSSPRPIKNYFTDSPDGVNWIKIGDTKNVDRYLYSTNQKITKKGAENSRLVKEGDLILSNSMSFGRPYIMKTTGYIHDGWFVLRPKPYIDTEYFYDAISSPQIQKQFIALASGSVVKNISGDLVKKAILLLPTLAEQKIIVKKINTLSTETKKLEEIYKKKLEDLEELKKSILQKAFSGKL